MRHLVTVRTVEKVSPVPGADLIEAVRVGGWDVVTRKGAFVPGQKVVYFEVDSLLPEGDPRYAELMRFGVRTLDKGDGTSVRGHVLRTKMFRGTLSQGFVKTLEDMGIEEGTPVGADVTELAGVVKWEPPATEGSIGEFDTRFAPKSDAERIQNLTQHWEEITSLRWDATVKVDGTSRTFVNDGGEIKVFSRNHQIAPGQAMALADASGLTEVLRDHPGMAVQAELLGPKVQGNRLRLPAARLAVFAVYDKGRKVPRAQWDPRLEALAVPLLGPEWQPQSTVEEMVKKVSGIKGLVTDGVPDEGVVFHLADGQNAPAWLDRTGCFKIVSNTYLLKHKL